MRILVTGGAGFIGSAVIRRIIHGTDHDVLNIDKLTYAGNLQNLSSVQNAERYRFSCVDICDRGVLSDAISDFKPDGVLNLAAETHVDRSISDPSPFIHTNIVGTYNLLQVLTSYCQNLPADTRARFKLVHVSTDEVFGDLGDSDGLFVETSPYAPSSPYSASKASADHLVRAWHRTYGLPSIITNCSNNFGPYQFPEKLIPVLICNALAGKPLPIYGEGLQVRDWLYVDDHADALLAVLATGEVGETYNVGAGNVIRNIDLVHLVCNLLDESVADKPRGIGSFHDLISFVEDRPGHDTRYAIDATKIETELHWRPRENFKSGLKKTIDWYLGNQNWCDEVLNGRG